MVVSYMLVIFLGTRDMGMEFSSLETNDMRVNSEMVSFVGISLDISLTAASSIRYGNPRTSACQKHS